MSYTVFTCDREMQRDKRIQKFRGISQTSKQDGKARANI